MLRITITFEIFTIVLGCPVQDLRYSTNTLYVINSYLITNSNISTRLCGQFLLGHKSTYKSFKHTHE